MAQNTVFLLVLAILSLGSLAFYGRIALALGRLPLGRINTSLFKGGDVFFALILVAYILLNIWMGVAPAKKTVVTFDSLLSGAVLSLFIVTIILTFLSMRKVSPIEVFGLRWPGGTRRLLFVGAALLAVYPLLVLAMIISGHFFGTAPQDIVEFLQTHTTLRDRVIIVVFAVLVAPLTEEIIFRGYLHGVIRKYGGPWCAILVTAMLFAAIHVHLPVLAPLFLLGLALSLVYEFTGSLWAPLLMHACFNAITIIVALNWPELLL